MATTLPASKRATLPLPTLSEVVVEASVYIAPEWTVGEWVASPFFAITFSVAGDTNAGPGITVWNSGRIDGDDNSGNNVVGAPEMVGGTEYVVRVEWRPTGLIVKINGVEYSLPEPLINEGFLEAGPQADIAVNIYSHSPGGGQVALSLDYVDISGLSESASPPFWTGFLGTREVGASSGGSPDPGGGEPTVFTEVALPYSEPVPTGTNFRWYKVIVETASTQRFSTLNSPNAEADPYLALYSSTGEVLASNEDIDPDNANYLAQFDYAVTPGIYWLAIATYEGGSSSNWGLLSGGPLDTGLLLEIGEAP
ncbi:hypothetical protein ABL850_15550 [Variovorax paradoxus]|uniref:hypothetical protein n=1 Tax=Variovorax paradoxus TaxID=34073 RepID=UPI000425469A